MDFDVERGSGSYAEIANVQSLQTVDHLWEFLKGPLLNTLYPFHSDDGTGIQETQIGTVARNANQLLGSPRLRQVRTNRTRGTEDEDKCGGEPKGSAPRLSTQRGLHVVVMWHTFFEGIL